MLLLSITTALSAFLLFQIELITAKLFLPHYGGSYLVWGACMVFFQAVLLAGYLFAHLCLKRLGLSTYLKLHILFLFVPILFFPIRDFHLSFQELNLPLVLDIFWRLLITIGPVFFVLSTMSLVTQSWLAQSLLKGRDNPYMLYAISNVGSFAGLLTYPFVMERFLSNDQQLEIWRGLYALLALGNGLAFYFVKTNSSASAKLADTVLKPIPFKDTLPWLCLGAGGVVLFFSVTNIISYEVAPVPLLWIIPLGIYLLAFILNFKKTPWFPLWINRFIGPILGLQVLMYFLAQKNFLPVILVIVLLNFFLFLVCMYIQHRLIISKPADSRHMTLFFVMISLGGFLGGILTSWIIPLVSNTLIEYLVGVLLIAFILPRDGKDIPLWKFLLAVILLVLCFVVWPHFYLTYHLLPISILVVGIFAAFFILVQNKSYFILTLVVIILTTPFLESMWQNKHFILKKRNYYGIYEIYDRDDGIRVFLHGTTLHGIEFKDPESRTVPLGYYSSTSALGSLLIADIFLSKRVGVIGLGTGTLAMYSKLNCPVDYFELDKDVYDLAKRYFWYIKLAPGDVRVLLGDARISLTKIPDNTYDILAVDAFSGDSIPTHLVNKDVLVLYRHKITNNGAIVFHITNRYLNLEPVLAKMAAETGAYIAIKDVGDGGSNMRSIWCILTWDSDRFLKLIENQNWDPLDIKPQDQGRVWSDGYSSILPILNMQELAVSLKSFKPFS